MNRFKRWMVAVGLLLAVTSHADDYQAVFLYDASGNGIASTSAALNAFITNASLAVSQFGTWTTAVTQSTAANLNATVVGPGGTVLAKDSSLVTINTTLGSPLQAGGSIGSITGTITLPTGASTASNQTSQITQETTTASNSTSILANQTNKTQFTKVTDGTNNATVKAASTPAGTTDTALVVVVSPNNTIAATQSGTWTFGRTWTLGSGTDSVTTFQGTSPWVDNITQFGGTNLSTGTGASGAGIPRVTVSNDSNILASQSGTWTVQQGATPTTVANGWPVKPTDGTNTITIKAASTSSLITDTAQVITDRPDKTGTVTFVSVSCLTTSTTFLAAGTATMFLSIRNPTTALTTVWIRFDGSAATAAAPSIDLPPGAEWTGFAYGTSWLPTSQFNCISGGAAASTLSGAYK